MLSFGGATLIFLSVTFVISAMKWLSSIDNQLQLPYVHNANDTILYIISKGYNVQL